MDEILREYLNETGDLLDGAERALVRLDGARADRAAIDEIFRAAHTIKGNSAFFDFYAIADVTHALEGALHEVRDGRLELSDPVMEGFFAGFDAVKVLYGRLRAGEPPGEPPEGIVARLESLTGAGASAPAPPPAPHEATESRPPVPDPSPDATPPAEPPDEPVAVSGALPSSPAADPAPAAPPIRPPASAQGPEETLRIRVSYLNRLIEHIGELVTIRSGLHLVDRKLSDPDLSRLHLRMDKALRKLRDLSLSLRMLPVSHLFDRFPRLVRDLAQQTGKKARLVTEGGETELDRNIIEELADPLVHLVRNSIDHGIEAPAVRRVSGKDETGTLRMSARHVENHVVIEIRDDGSGIDREGVLRKAVEVGIVERGGADALSLDDIIDLIFEPGFSTREKVTALSGRGVGMDVVRSRVESLHGTIVVKSVPGEGTTFELRLPLTLAILQVLLVESAGHLFGLPLLSVEETSKFDPAAVEREPGFEFLNLRGESLRLAPLADLFGRPGCASGPRHAVMIRHGERRVALLVDRLAGKHEIVLKPLGAWLGRVPGVMGAAVLGDGRLVPILEIGALLREHFHD